MGWLRLVGSLKLQVSFSENSLFYRSLLHKRPIILRSLLVVATPYVYISLHFFCMSPHLPDIPSDSRKTLIDLESARPNQWFMFLYWCVYFTKVLYLSSSTNIQNLVPRILSCRIWSSAQEYAVLVLFLNIVESLISTWPKWSSGNVLYQACTSSKRANRRGWPLNVFTRVIGAGGHSMYATQLLPFHTCRYSYI